MDWGSTLPQKQKSPVTKGFGARASFTGFIELQKRQQRNKECLPRRLRISLKG